MGKHAFMLLGPAGSGKSTSAHILEAAYQANGRAVHVVNLDPAAEAFDYTVAADIRELISVDDAMEQLGLGPNGALLYCMEYCE